MDIRADVIKTISEVFDFPTQKIRVDMTSDDIEKWDSLQRLNLIMALENKFKIQFDMDDTFKIKNVESILIIVESKL